MEFISIDLDYENESLGKLKKYLVEQMYAKKHKEICLEFSEIPKPKMFMRIMELFLEYKSCYLKMVKYVKKRDMDIIEAILHSGEEMIVKDKKIIVGDFHEGSHLFLENHVIFIGKICGEVTLKNSTASIFATKFQNAKIHDQHGLIEIVNGENVLINNESIGGKLWHA